MVSRQEFPGETEVRDFRSSSLNEYVFRLEISVGKGVELDEFEAGENLHEEFFGLQLGELVLLQEVEEISVFSQLHDEEYVPLGFYYFVDANHVDVYILVPYLGF